jgi:ribosomal protein S18 acetylase RimI-like enzyme
VQLRSAGFVTDLMVRRLAGSEIIDRGDHIVVRTPANPTFWWGNFIVVGADFSDADRWLSTFAEEHPTAAHVAIGVDAPDADVDLAGYVAAGLEADVSTILFASRLDDPTENAGVVCRSLSSDADWVQSLELTLACHPSEEESEVLFMRRKVIELQVLSGCGNGGWFGAFVDGTLRASLGVLTDGDGLARYQSVETHPEYRRRGLARQLVATAGRTMLAEPGVTSLVMVADPTYHAAHLYRSLGFVDGDHQIQLEASAPS